MNATRHAAPHTGTVESSEPRTHPPRSDPFAGRLGPVLQVSGDARDITERFEPLMSRVRAMLDVAPIALWISENGRLVFANRAAARLFAVDEARSLLGQPLATWIHVADRDALRSAAGRALSGGQDCGPQPCRVVRADGECREVEITIAALPEHGPEAVQMVASDATPRRAEALELERSRALLRQLSASVVEAREAERRRIARELHDELGQRLTALKMELSGMAHATGLAPDDAHLGTMMSMLDETVASVRRIAADLRPLMLDDLGLAAAIEWLASDASQRLGIEVDVDLGDDNEPAVDERVAIALYRMVQEALTNVARHARATSVHIELGRRDDELTLSVHDNGVGFGFDEQALQRQGSYGLLGMRERARMLGGHLEVATPPGGGGRVTVRVPLNPSSPADAHRPRS